mgnify:CR=1 FL=1
MNLSELFFFFFFESRKYVEQKAYSDVLKSHHSVPVDSQIARLLLESLRDRFIARLPDNSVAINNHFETFIPVIIKTYRRYEKYQGRQPIRSCLFSGEWAKELIIHYAGELCSLFVKNNLAKLIKSPISH